MQYKTNLNQAAWFELTRHAGTGAPIVITDATTNGPSRFYRVKVECLLRLSNSCHFAGGANRFGLKVPPCNRPLLQSIRNPAGNF